MTRTVQDAAILLEGVAGFDPRDPGSAPDRQFRAADLDRVDLKRLRVGVPHALLESAVDREVRGIVEQGIEQLAALVATVETVDLPSSAELLAVEYMILYPEAAAEHQPWLRTQPKDYAPLTRDRLEAGSTIPAIHYIDAHRRRRAVIEQFAKIHERVDVLVLPSAPISAMPLSATTELTINGEPTDIFDGLIRITGPFNVTGAPAVSIPCGKTPAGLPVGLQLAGRHFEDHVVLAAARGLERARADAPQLPPLVVDRSVEVA
jgi:aspartyl-tRNA(Asn)/glutamyl-tRNA(Gln) amidotransferase subunit A